MSGESNLDRLLEKISPQLHDGSFVFLTSSEIFPPDVLREAVMIFKEIEGLTVIARDEIVGTLGSGAPRWAMITLNVHSDLNAVGFLAVITKRLAEAGISVNAVSAYYHDHLFIPWDRKDEAMKILMVNHENNLQCETNDSERSGAAAQDS